MHKGENQEKITTADQIDLFRGCELKEREDYIRSKYKNRIIFAEVLLFVVTIGGCAFYLYRAHKGEFRRNVEYLSTMEVTAHRGASRYYPENTMSAFQGAVEAGADWIELDVHKSKDDQVFVMHDRTFKRTTGVNAKAWELTYDEISQLDAGSFFKEEFAGERIPLLSEAIEFAKLNGVRLNIEIKPSAEEEGLEKLLVDLIHETNFMSDCVVTSQQYSAIEKVKELDEEITTVYVTGFAYGNLNRMKAADNFSVRASSVTDTLVSRIHNAGKQIYAWTVNGRDAANLMIEKQVDNIITDDVPMAKKCIGQKIASSAVNDYVSFLNRQIRLRSYRLRK